MAMMISMRLAKVFLPLVLYHSFGKEATFNFNLSDEDGQKSCSHDESD